MYIVKGSYCAKCIEKCVKDLENELLIKCLTDLYNDFDIIYFTGSGFDMYYSVLNKEVYFFGNIPEEVKHIYLNKAISYMQDLNLYIEWLDLRKYMKGGQNYGKS